MRRLIIKAFVLTIVFCSCNDTVEVNKMYDFELEVLPVPKEISENETVEIRCQIIKSKEYEGNEFKIRYFQSNGKGELRLSDGTLLTPNDLFTLEYETFRLYYTSKTTKQQTIDIYIIDSFNQVIEKSFSFSNATE